MKHARDSNLSPTARQQIPKVIGQRIMLLRVLPCSQLAPAARLVIATVLPERLLYGIYPLSKHYLVLPLPFQLLVHSGLADDLHQKGAAASVKLCPWNKIFKPERLLYCIHTLYKYCLVLPFTFWLLVHSRLADDLQPQGALHQVREAQDGRWK